MEAAMLDCDHFIRSGAIFNVFSFWDFQVITKTK